MGNLWLLGEGDHFFKSLAPGRSTMVSEWPHMQEWVGLKNKKNEDTEFGIGWESGGRSERSWEVNIIKIYYIKFLKN